ncbi:MAG: hypothetical protein ACRD30_08905, partial [Bryobacteraceae bacterium]
MRQFFNREHPEMTRLVLIESGSRGLLDRLIPALYQMYGADLEIDLVTCFAGVPDGFRGSVYRIHGYAGRPGRKRLYAELAARGYSAAGIVCSGESIMTKWKWALGARLPCKIFVVNENADFFWLEISHWRMILHFALFRAGLTGAAAVPALARLLFFPFTLAYLLCYAGCVHLRRFLL